ncbi:mannose-6-phosphate isomerase, class I, partial [Candidatus Omnitrophota bacterium]
MQPNAPPITWLSAPDPSIFENKSLLELYPTLSRNGQPDLTKIDDLVNALANSQKKLDTEPIPVITLAQFKAIQTYKRNPTPLVIHCAVMHYAWGDPEYIPALLRIDNSQRKPYAELWIGAHPKAPATTAVVDIELKLNDLINGAAAEILGAAVAKQFDAQLPYLFKVLTAARPLSIQAHPNKLQAEEGWAREKGQGPNYRDDNHKPEICCALSEFWALNGFRPIKEIIANFEALNISELQEILQRFKRDKSLRDFYSSIMKLSQPDMDSVVRRITDRAESKSQEANFQNSEEDWALRCTEACIQTIDDEIDSGNIRPEDRDDKIKQSLRGIPSIYLLNLVCLKPGQAMYLPAGELHAYLHGAIMELMANSDNVLRGGMTHKHMDIDELLGVLTFASGKPKILTPKAQSAAESVYTTKAREFELSIIEVKKGQNFTSSDVHSADALIVHRGEVEVTDAQGYNLQLGQGATFLIPARSGAYTIKAKTASAGLYKASVPHSEPAQRGPGIGTVEVINRKIKPDIKALVIDIDGTVVDTLDPYIEKEPKIVSAILLESGAVDSQKKA